MTTCGVGLGWGGCWVAPAAIIWRSCHSSVVVRCCWGGGIACGRAGGMVGAGAGISTGACVGGGAWVGGDGRGGGAYCTCTGGCETACLVTAGFCQAGDGPWRGTPPCPYTGRRMLGNARPVWRGWVGCYRCGPSRCMASLFPATMSCCLTSPAGLCSSTRGDTHASAPLCWR